MASSDLYSPDLSEDNVTSGDGGGDGEGGDPTSPTSSATNCSMPVPDWKRDYNVATATICGMYLVFGVMCAFFGYR